MTSNSFRSVLFFTFITIFAATAVLTLLGITNVIPIRDGYLNTLFTSLIVETVGAVITLFRATSFTRGNSAEDVKLITGAWWEIVTSGREDIAMSFVRITHSPKTDAIVLAGDAYSPQGKRAADWTSSRAWLDEESSQLVYLWSGNEIVTKVTELTGIGVIRFRSKRDDAPADEGFGWFISPAVPTPDGTRRILIEMRRASDSERDVMLGEDHDAKAQLVTKLSAAR